ncbi:hypothetical protein M1307_03050 [Patescibacteria group bacterium]|nr:hypothetical protein [Patescibacteria group bacterium]
MTKQEGEKGTESSNYRENGNLLQINPAELMRDNPAALIVNKESYERMEINFSPDRFDPPQVVKVRTYSLQHGEIIKIFVVDGLTRTKFVNDHREEIAKKDPMFSFVVRDVTNSELKNSKTVPKRDQIEGRDTLTMVEYLRAVVPPTVEHSEIASDRIAAHLINGWENMVGPEISDKFSALAAISFLNNPRVPMATDEMLRKFLNSQAKIMIEEKPIGDKDRQRLQEKLIEMASIIRSSKLFRQEIASSAFMLVATGSSTIGGEKEASKQTYGLLHTPEAEKKLAETFPDMGVREQMRIQLGGFILETIKRFKTPREQEQIGGLISEALQNKDITFNHINDIFASVNPIERYTEIRQDLNREKLRKAYMNSKKNGNATDLTVIESQLISRLGGVTYLDESQIQSIISSIKSARSVINHRIELVEDLTVNKEELLKKGVRPQTVDEGLTKLDSTNQALLSASIARLPQSIEKMKDVNWEVEQKVTEEITRTKIGEIADQVFGEELSKGYGPNVRNSFVYYAYRTVVSSSGFPEISNTMAVQIKNIFQQLKSLDVNLRAEVVRGERRLDNAIRIQKDRQREQAKPRTEKEVQKSEKAEKIVEEPIDAIPLSTPVFPAEEEIVLIDKKKAEERRIAVNNERFRHVLSNAEFSLRDIDIDPVEISEETRSAAYYFYRETGKKIFNHPDIVRLIENALEEEKKKSKILEDRIQMEREQTDKDTRTGR